MIPLVRPSPLGLGEAASLLAEIEDRGVLSNFGPVNTAFERDLLEQMFDGTGACLTTCNATLGLMLAIRQATEGRAPHCRFALMPSFTFAAAAQAALWCGLTPLFCDIDRHSWAADAESEEELLQRHRGEIAVVVPYATFGYDIDLARYEDLKQRHGLPVVVDAAASLGTLSAAGHGFGTGFSGAVVFSMHATKSFSAGEGGVIYSGDRALIEQLRVMANFGFGAPRSATMPGLNAKMSEFAALLAARRLERYDRTVRIRDARMHEYRALFPQLSFQPEAPRRQAHQFVPALLPRGLAGRRPALQARMQEHGIGMATYFSPHVAEQPYFAANSASGRLDVTRDVAARIISLPLFDVMTSEDVRAVARCFNEALSAPLDAAFAGNAGLWTAAPSRHEPAPALRAAAAAPL